MRVSLLLFYTVVALAWSVPAQAAPAKDSLRIIDVHRHAPRIGADDAEARRKALQSMDHNNIVSSLVYINERSNMDDWVKSPSGRFIASAAMPCWRNRDGSYYCFPETGGWPDLRWLERELAAGRISALGEMLFNYSGVRADDPRMWPYWALAAKYDVPVFVHTGRGPGPGEGLREEEGCCVGYDESLGNPALLRPVLERYPRLRIALLHFGAGSREHPYFHTEALALLRDYSSVYVDLTILSSMAPPKVYAAEIRRLIDAGFGDRIMFGTDNLPPEPIIERLAAMSWMTRKQRRAILYDNAARFLRLTAKQKEHERRQ
jgi:uncharacterized protein